MSRRIEWAARIVATLAITGCDAARNSKEPTRAGEPTGESRVAPDAAGLRAEYSRPPLEWPAPTIDAGVEYVELGLVPKPSFPATSPWSKAKEELGKTLFFDGRLSGSGEMACASCHAPELGFADGRATSFGHRFKPLKRNAPSILNAAFQQNYFWDGRAASLEDQALGVFQNENEMNTDGEAIVRKLSAIEGYRELFDAAFGDPTPTLAATLSALATFERTIASDGSSDFDSFLKGKSEAMSDAAIRGLHLFRTKARCANCHHGPTLSDGKFHDIGLSYYGRELQDLGRYEVTKDPKDVGRFKTPSLRNVARTAPYMHNGLFELDGIINAYNAGMPTLKRKDSQRDDALFPTKSPLLRPLELSREERSDLLAFLESLTERRRRIRAPDLP